MRQNGWMRAIASGALAAAMLSFVQADAQTAPGQTKKFKTTVDYVTHFYPLWFTYYQSSLLSTTNRLAGPVRVTPLYQIVVAINVDTYYASAFLDTTNQPAMLTIPATTVSYSVLTLDPYGNTLDVGLPKAPGVYALAGPSYTGKIPKATTRIDMPYNHMVLIFRADKYASTGESEKKEAELFRRSLQLQTLKDWRKDKTGGKTAILPELFFAPPFKTAADALATRKPLDFLAQLQAAVLSPNTPPLSAKEQKLSDTFNALYAESGDMFEFASGTQAAHQLIVDDYLTHTDKNNWINFTNMGTWKPGQFLDRAAITEFIQYGNNHSTAAYYQAFKDRHGAALDGSDGAVYVLHISKKEIPAAERFWSFTAYTPESIELIRNSAKKYNIASYTPGLVYGDDGSLTLWLSKVRPSEAPEANWLHVSSGRFNIMLRVYGPEGTVAKGTYVPPPIVKQ